MNDLYQLLEVTKEEFYNIIILYNQANIVFYDQTLKTINDLLDGKQLKIY